MEVSPLLTLTAYLNHVQECAKLKHAHSSCWCFFHLEVSGKQLEGVCYTHGHQMEGSRSHTITTFDDTMKNPAMTKYFYLSLLSLNRKSSRVISFIFYCGFISLCVKYTMSTYFVFSIHSKKLP